MYTPVPRLLWCWIRHKTCEASILDLDEYTRVKLALPWSSQVAMNVVFRLHAAKDTTGFLKNTVDSICLNNFLQKRFCAVTEREIWVWQMRLSPRSKKKAKANLNPYLLALACSPPTAPTMELDACESTEIEELYSS